MAKGKQVATFTAPNLFYLTGFFGGGAAVVHPDKTEIITTPLEADRALEVSKEAEIVVVKSKDLMKEVARRLEERQTVVDRGGVQMKGTRLVTLEEVFLEARRAKDEIEIEKIRKACAGTDRVFQELEKELRPGRTEWELAAGVMKAATEQRMTPSNSESSLGPIIIASGPHGAYGHSELSGRRLRSGDFVVADLFFRYEGYHSDETRTFAIGSVSPEMKERYSIVKEAEEAALESAREGAACGSVSDAAVKVLRRHAVDRYLNHSVGHGVGIDIHELPRITQGNRVRLVSDDVITDEPGIYLVGKYGIRIEDTIRVGRKPTVLTRFTKDLVTCG
ncbi:MAG: aminopeptidase P family protein [Nitrososphaerota archaeon]|nr:aminopeptidase P family protein [Nitrososphaerota archaeon]MDG7023389.1 aminopeptidase P family protein [Nitrososphaerota archaeon]